MSVACAFVWLILGIGLLGLGAFFVWRWVGCRGGAWAVFAAVLPVTAVVSIAVLAGQTEMAVGMLWGTVAVNLAFMGILHCFASTRPTGCSHCLWLAFGLGACMVAGHRGGFGMFSGWGLVVVGLIAFWQRLHQRTADKTEQVPWVWWQGLVLAGAVLGVLIGAWLMVGQVAVVGAVMGMPPSIFGAVVMSPLVAVVGWTALRRHATANLWHGWAWSNVALSTVVLGLVVVLSGGLHLTQSMVLVTLPWVTGMVALSVVAAYIPNKTARYWGGLVAVMYVAYLISLFC